MESNDAIIEMNRSTSLSICSNLKATQVGCNSTGELKMPKRKDMEIPRDVVDVYDTTEDSSETQGAHCLRQKLTGRTEFEFEIGKLGCSESVL